MHESNFEPVAGVSDLVLARDMHPDDGPSYQSATLVTLDERRCGRGCVKPPWGTPRLDAGQPLLSELHPARRKTREQILACPIPGEGI